MYYASIALHSNNACDVCETYGEINEFCLLMKIGAEVRSCVFLHAVAVAAHIPVA